ANADPAQASGQTDKSAKATRPSIGSSPQSHGLEEVLTAHYGAASARLEARCTPCAGRNHRDRRRGGEGGLKVAGVGRTLSGIIRRTSAFSAPIGNVRCWDKSAAIVVALIETVSTVEVSSAADNPLQRVGRCFSDLSERVAINVMKWFGLPAHGQQGVGNI